MRNSFVFMLFTTFLMAQFVVPQSARGWSMQGHGVTSQWLLDSMSLAERQYLEAKFTALENASLGLAQEQRFYTQTAGAWPDKIRKVSLESLFDSLSTPLPSILHELKSRDSNRWHYHNTPHFLNAESAQRCKFKNKGELLVILRRIDRGLAEPVSDVQEAVLLSFFIHLALDLHQPLHTISAVDEQCKHDYGGNTYCVGVRVTKRCPLNLHGLWDAGFGLFDSEEFARKFISSTSPAMLSSFNSDADILAFSPERWIEEGALLAADVYSTDPKPSLSEAYLNRSREISRDRLAVGLWRIRVYLQRHIASVGANTAKKANASATIKKQHTATK